MKQRIFVLSGEAALCAESCLATPEPVTGASTNMGVRREGSGNGICINLSSAEQTAQAKHNQGWHDRIDPGPEAVLRWIEIKNTDHVQRHHSWRIRVME